MEFVAYPLAALGFIFGLVAYTQIESLKDRVTAPEKKIEAIEENGNKDGNE